MTSSLFLFYKRFTFFFFGRELLQMNDNGSYCGAQRRHNKLLFTNDLVSPLLFLFNFMAENGNKGK